VGTAGGCAESAYVVGGLVGCVLRGRFDSLEQVRESRTPSTDQAAVVLPPRRRMRGRGLSVSYQSDEPDGRDLAVVVIGSCCVLILLMGTEGNAR
jgi:hypothetical protein